MDNVDLVSAKFFLKNGEDFVVFNKSVKEIYEIYAFVRQAVSSIIISSDANDFVEVIDG